MNTGRFELPLSRLTKTLFYDKIPRSTTDGLEDPNRSTELRYTPENDILLENLDPEASGSRLPDFDYGSATKLACSLGITVVWLVIITCIIIGIICIKKGTNSTNMYPTGLSFGDGHGLSLGVNIFLTICLEALGYTQGASLRWGLFHEGRLEFNSNVRLFTRTRKQPQNSLMANILCAISLILCYAASSQLIVFGTIVPKGKTHAVSGAYVNGIALLILALGLGVKATVSTWIMATESRSILSWSSNPLNNTLTALHHEFEPRPKRCMISAHQANLMMTAVRPREKQQSAKELNHSIKYIVLFAWVLPILALIIFAVLVALSKRAYGKNWHFSSSWTEIDDGTTPAALNTVVFHLPQSIGPTPILILGVLLQCAIQGTQTLSLHAIELVVNISRDEEIWRSAVGKRGTRSQSNPFTSASLSWQTSVLFIAKALLHWFLGQTFSGGFRQLTVFQNAPFFYNWYLMYIWALAYTIGTTALAAFTTFLAYRKPKGPQPAAFGHLQTVADLIDDWTVDEKGCFWWGDKGVGDDGVRHAGTSSRREDLGQIHLDALYAG